jgi:hypothetical protein
MQYSPSYLECSFVEDVHAFLERDVSHRNPEQVAPFHRVAMNPEDIEQHNLTTYEAKSTDGRSKEWLRLGRETCQLEALPPNVLADNLREAIEAFLDADMLETNRQEEEKERRQITRALPGVL